MKNVVIAAVLMFASFAVVAQDVRTTIRPDGSVVTTVAVMQEKCSYQNKSNLGNAVIGAGVGYVSGRVVGGRRSSNGGLIGAAAGALIGANTQKGQEKRCESVLIGHKVIVTKNGKVNEAFVPVK